MRNLTMTVLFALLIGVLVGAQSYQRVDFNKLSNYEYELPDPFDPAPRSGSNEIPAAIKALNGG